MSLLSFLFEVVVISLSGVMSPGPLTAVMLEKGSTSLRARPLIAVGHGIVEFPLMVLLFYGFGYLQNLAYMKTAIGFAGGIMLFVIGIGMLQSVKKVSAGSVKSADAHAPITAGILTSAGNPYFLIWWLTIGAALILRSTAFGIFGFLIFALVHWLCDFSWYSFLSAISFRGRQFFGDKFQKAVFAVCGAFLLLLGARFIREAWAAV